MIFDNMNIWRFPYYINKPSLASIALQLFQIRPFSHFSLSYNLTSDDLWPWKATFDIINKWGFPCCNYDPTLAEIHQSMWELEPNVVNLFSQQQTTTTTTTTGEKVIPVSFLLRQVTHKVIIMLNSHTEKWWCIFFSWKCTQKQHCKCKNIILKRSGALQRCEYSSVGSGE